jgi:hypothetical protein
MVIAPAAPVPVEWVVNPIAPISSPPDEYLPDTRWLLPLFFHHDDRHDVSLLDHLWNPKRRPSRDINNSPRWEFFALVANKRAKHLAELSRSYRHQDTAAEKK